MNSSYILYIDDERTAIKLIGEALKLSGYDVRGATSGRQGLAMMRDEKPALLLLDLGLSDMSGAEVYRQIKQDPLLNDVPVIVVSGKIPEAGLQIVADLPPVDDYITKPFKINRLVRSMDRFFKVA